MEEEEPTQPATQLVTDPRRLGESNQTGLSDDDLTDIFCILHPASIPAHMAIAQIAEESPELIISTRGAKKSTNPTNLENDVASPGAEELSSAGITPHDIALRFSTIAKNPLMGFCFGRNKQRCDYVLGGTSEGAKRISNVHFRITIDEHGIIMIEDQSTNGTMVENIMLYGKRREEGHAYRHILEQGSLITLLMMPPEDDYKFIVRVPFREGIYEDLYYQNRMAYCRRLKQVNAARQQEKGTVGGNGLVNPTGQAPDLFADETETGNKDGESGRESRDWKGGTRYNRIGTVGKGAFATVYKIAAKFDGTVYAAKELEKRRFIKNGILDQKVENEMKIMSKISHPNVVRYIEQIDWHEYLYLILEFVPQGDLGAYISNNGQLPEPTVKSIAKQLLSALKHLHQLGITHRDIKPDNILIESKFPFSVKLTDFGLSKMIEDDDTFLRTFCGTLLYCAPEVYSEYREYDLEGNRTYRNREKKTLPPQKYGQAVDIWSLGAVLFYVLAGVPPFPASQGTTYQELLQKIMTEPLDIRPLQHAGVSLDGIRFIRTMLNIRPLERATIDELEASNWLVDGPSRPSVDESDSDEVDLVAAADTPIEQSASQLSIQDPEMDDDINIDSFAGILPRQQNSDQVIPSSFPSVGSSSSESFTYMRNPPGNVRLFGEVGGSAIGSSGVIPASQLNLGYTQSKDYSEYDEESQIDPEDQYLQTNSLPGKGTMRSGDSTDSQEASTAPAALYDDPFQLGKGKGPITAPSLLGAESMVGNMAMNSPSPAPSAPSYPSTPVTAVNRLGRPFGVASMMDEGSFLMSRRRSRDDSDEDSDAENRRPTAKRTKSKQHSSADITFSPGLGTRAQSEPAFQLGAGMDHKMKRDERALSDVMGSLGEHGSSSQGDSLTMSAIEAFAAENPAYLNPTIAGFGRPSALHARVAVYAHSAAPTFQAPLPILARFTSTPDSALQGIAINVTSSVTTWGRGKSNLIVYPNAEEAKLPRYAFKLILWEPMMSPWDDLSSGDQLRFWITTKATCGIKVNGVLLQSANTNPRAASNCWGELRHGDEITVWSSDLDPAVFTRLKFECFMGICKTLRPEGVDFKVLQDSIYTEGMDAFCLEVENDKLARRANEEGAADAISGPPTY